MQQTTLYPSESETLLPLGLADFLEEAQETGRIVACWVVEFHPRGANETYDHASAQAVFEHVELRSKNDAPHYRCDFETLSRASRGFVGMNWAEVRLRFAEENGADENGDGEPSAGDLTIFAEDSSFWVVRGPDRRVESVVLGALRRAEGRLRRWDGGRFFPGASDALAQT